MGSTQSAQPEDENNRQRKNDEPLDSGVAVAQAQKEEDDEPDDWDKRIFSTGCSEENAKMTDCYFETKDWRACKDEMQQFKECWKRHGNEKRTSSKDT